MAWTSFGVSNVCEALKTQKNPRHAPCPSKSNRTAVAWCRASTSSFQLRQRRGWPGRLARRRASRFCPAMTQKCLDDDGELDDVHRRQTGAATAASPEMAIVRQARTDPDDPLWRVVPRFLAVGDG